MRDFNEIKKTVFDEVVKTSRLYVVKEQVRAELQEMIVSRISSGSINSPEEAQDFIHAMKTAINVLENVPFESWKLIAGSNR